MTQPEHVPDRPASRPEVTTARSRPRRKRRQVGAGSLLLLLFLAYSYFIPRGTMWNADTRLFLTASVVDRGQLSIDPYAEYTGDKAAYGGHYYSDKAPGSSLLAIPAYLLVKLTLYQGKTTYLQLLSGPEEKRADFLARYLITVLLISLPAALLGGLLFTFLAYLGLGLRGRMLLTLGYGLGTIAFAFSTVFFSHQLAALLLFAAFYLLFRIRRGSLSAWHNLSAGLLAGYAIITEYPTAIIVGCLALYALDIFSHRRLWRALACFSVGLLPALAIGAIYNTLCFGGPLNQGYANLVGPEAFRIGQSQGLLGITLPHLDALWQTTFGPYRGLFLLSPFLLLAVPGFIRLFRQHLWRAEAILWLSIILSYFVFTISYFAWDGGFSLGPRHFVPVLPFLVLPIATLLKERGWVRTLAVALIGFSVIVVTWSVAVYPLNDPQFDAPLTERVLPLLLGLQPDPQHPVLAASTLWQQFWQEAPFFLHARLDNNWGQLFHLQGLWQLFPLALAQGFILLRFWRRTRRTPAQPPQPPEERFKLTMRAADDQPIQTPPSPERSAGDAHADPVSLPDSAHPGSPAEKSAPQ